MDKYHKQIFVGGKFIFVVLSIIKEIVGFFVFPFLNKCTELSKSKDTCFSRGLPKIRTIDCEGE